MDYHRLYPIFPALLFSLKQDIVVSHNPTYTTTLVWANSSKVLRHCLGESLHFSIQVHQDVSVPCVSFPHLGMDDILQNDAGVQPIRKSSDQSSYLQFRLKLSQFITSFSSPPRAGRPPCALLTLSFFFSTFYSRTGIGSISFQSRLHTEHVGFRFIYALALLQFYFCAIMSVRLLLFSEIVRITWIEPDPLRARQSSGSQLSLIPQEVIKNFVFSF